MYVDYIPDTNADYYIPTADDWAEYEEWLGENDGRDERDDDFDENDFVDIGDFLDEKFPTYYGEGGWRGDMESHAHLVDIREEDIPF